MDWLKGSLWYESLFLGFWKVLNWCSSVKVLFNLLENQWRTGTQLISWGEYLASGYKVDTKTGVFQGDSLSPLFFYLHGTPDTNIKKGSFNQSMEPKYEQEQHIRKFLYKSLLNSAGLRSRARIATNKKQKYFSLPDYQLAEN